MDSDKLNTIAKLLDVKVGEQFAVEGLNDEVWYLSGEGLRNTEYKNTVYYALLGQLLFDKKKVIKLPYSPNGYGDTYFYITADGDVYCATYLHRDIDLYRYKHGNCFGSENEAREHIDEAVNEFKTIKDEILQA